MHRFIQVLGIVLIAIGILSGVFWGNTVRLERGGFDAFFYLSATAIACGILGWALGAIVEHLIAIRRAAEAQLKIFTARRLDNQA